MKRFTFVLTFLLFTIFNIFGFDGHVSQNTTWTTDQIITGDVYIDPGVTLTIAAGVKVYFTYIDQNSDGIGDIKFYIQGRLLTQGTPSQKVYFKPYDTVIPAAQKGKVWGGIQYTTAASGDLSTLAFTEILHAHQGFYINGRNVTFSSCRIAECHTNAIYIQSTIYTTTLNNTILEDCGGYGLRIEQGTLIINDISIKNVNQYGFYAQNSNITLTDATIHTCGQYGVKMATGVQMNATGLNIKHCQQEGLWIENTTSLTINNARIVSNKWDGIRINNDNPTINNSLIANNGRNGILITHAASSPTLYQCTVSDNYNNGLFFADGCIGNVSYCQIINNNAAGISVIENALPILNNNNIFQNCPDSSEILPGAAVPLYGGSTIQTKLPAILGLLRLKLSASGSNNPFFSDYIGNQVLSVSVNTIPGWYGLTASGTNFFTRTSGSSAVFLHNADLGTRSKIQLATSNASGVINAQNNYWGQVSGVDARVFQNTTGTINYSQFSAVPVASAGCNLPNSAPLFTLTNPVGFQLNPTQVLIKWAADDEDNNAKVSLFYDDGLDTTGVQIGVFDEDGNLDSLVWSMTGLADGTYYIYGKIEDGVHPPVFSYAPGTLVKGGLKVSIPGNAIGVPGTDIEIPVRAINTIAYYNIISFQFTLTYSTSILTATGVETEFTLSEDWTVFANTSVPGQISVNGYATTPLTMGGDLVKILFTVNPAAANLATTPLNFADFTFNAGNPVPATVDGSFTAVRQYLISGQAYYYYNNNPVPNLKLSTTYNNGPLSVYSDGSGAYQFPPMLSGNYTIIPYYNAEVPPLVITPFDASITARYALSLYTLTNDQQKAADVDSNGNAEVFDAALMAQYSVGLITDFPSGRWFVSPSSVSYNLVNNLGNQNYKMVAFGDPSGNWQAPTSKNIQQSINVDNNQSNALIRIPVRAQQCFYSYLLHATYDPDDFTFLGIESDPALDNLQKYVNNTFGQVRIGAFGVNDICLNEDALVLLFQCKKSNVSSILASCLFDEIPGVFTETEDQDVLTTYLSQNQPNPASDLTIVSFGLARHQHVRINLLDIQGKTLSVLVDGNQSAGSHEFAMPVHHLSAGFHFLKMETEDGIIITRKVSIVK